MSSLAGIKDSISKFVDDQVDVLLENAIDLDTIEPETWREKIRELSETITGSPEINILVERVKRHLVRSIVSTGDKRVNSPGYLPEGYQGTNNKIFWSKLEKLPSISTASISELCGIFNSQPHDIISSKLWPKQCVILRNSLFCSNYKLFLLSLQIHAKLTHSLISYAVNEGFINLCTGVKSYYKNFYSDLIINFSAGIDLQNPVHICLIKICHLIVETMKILPRNWVRYGRRNVECVCEYFLNLLAFHIFTPHILVNGNKSDFMYPFHVVSTLDPSAEWCVCWLHSTFGRTVLLVTHASLARTLVQLCVDTLLQLFTENSSISSNMFATFIYSANVLKAVLYYREGRKLFPVIVPTSFGDKPISLNDFSLLLVRFVIKCDNSEVCMQQNVLNPAWDLFISLVGNWTLKTAEEEIVQVVMKPLCTGYVVSHSASVQHTLEFVSTFLKTRVGSKVLWGLRQKRELSSLSQEQGGVSRSASGISRSNETCVRLATRQRSTKSLRVSVEDVVDAFCPARLVIEFAVQTLKESQSYHLLEPLLDVCGSLLELHEGVACVCETEQALATVAVSVFRQLSDSQSVCQIHSTNSSFHFQASRAVLAFLVRVLLTPRGVWLLPDSTDVVLAAVRMQVCDPLADWEDARHRLTTSRLLLLHATHRSLAPHVARVLVTAFDRLRAVLQHPCTLAGSDDGLNNATQCFLAVVHTFASSLEGVANLLLEADDDSSVDTLVESDGPTSLLELLITDSSCEEWHYVALLVLRLLVIDLNVLLYLNHKLNLQVIVYPCATNTLRKNTMRYLSNQFCAGHLAL